MRRVSLKQLLLMAGALLGVILLLALILALLPLKYTPVVVAALMVLAFVTGGVAFSSYQGWAIERVRERHWRAARREMGLEDRPERD